MSNVIPLQSGGAVRPVVPQSMEDAYRLAKAIVMADMAPAGLDTPEKCMVAILHGLELGIPPMTALQRIAVVNNRPTLFGDGAMSLVRGSGLCEWVKETTEGEGEARVAVCTVKRKGEPEPVARRFSVDDAKRAGLWGKHGPWKLYPDRMLQMRARAFALRDVFADVMGGLYLKEELEGADNFNRQAAPPSPPPVASVPQVPSPPLIDHTPQPDNDPERQEQYERFEAALDEFDTAEEVHAFAEEYAPYDDEVCAAMVTARLRKIGGRR